MRAHHYISIGITALFLAAYPGQTKLLSFVLNQPEAAETQESAPVQLPDIPVTAKPNPILTAQGVYIADLATFTPLYQRASLERLYPASTTKIITALVAMDLYKLNDVVTIGKVKDEGQVMGLVAGEHISIENLLYGMLVYSGNDAAYAIADHYGYEGFISLMNKKASDLGMTNSRFLNPAGLDQQGHFSTPFDMALAGRAVLKNPELKHMVSTKEITVSDENYTIFHRLSNVNELLGQIQGVGGLKTGYTELAGENLISFYKRPDGREFLIVVMKSTDRFADTKEIISWLKKIAFINPNT
jgi:serine-type D-Ala-D-Ala carboxypeptidase (penicillin-binding protein 5/6)